MSKKIDWLLSVSVLIIVLSYILSWVGVGQYKALQEFCHHVVTILNTMALGIGVGLVFIILLSQVPKKFVVAILGTGGSLSSIIRAAIAGVLLDLCSHGILMVGAKLYERGLSLGQVFTFLIASPWNSFSLTIIMISLIGWVWTLVFITISLLIAIVSGLIIEFLLKRGKISPNPNAISMDQSFAFWAEAKKDWVEINWSWKLVLNAIIAGLKESRMVLRWIFFGLVLASVVRVVVPPDIYNQYFGPSLIGLGLTLVVATVLEVCSEGSLPLAADLLLRAKAPGNSFAFLMSGVATDYTEIMVLKEVTKSWKLALWLPLVTLPQVIIWGILLNACT